MKILHWAIIFLAIILPVSIVCRITVNSRFAALKDEVRINNAIDNATKDAIDQIIAVSGFDYDDEFGDVIDITPELAQECVNVFFHSMAINYNIPYRISDSTSLDLNDADKSYIKNYFSTYIPAIVIIAYDGFYIYSQERTAGGYYQYELSSKIPYAYTPEGANYTIGYTLGNDIYLYVGNTATDGKMYSGRFNYNSLDEVETVYNAEYASLDTETIASITNDMSIIIYSLLAHNPNALTGDKTGIVPTNGEVPFLQDYKRDTNGNYTVGAFHENRRQVIMNAISQCLTQEMNEHNLYADLVGCSYEFHLPEITDDDWVNSINDISIMAFIQGIPVGNSDGLYFNSYALGGSQIVKRDMIYGKTYNGYRLYHTKDCPLITGEDDYEYIFISEEDALNNDYHSCQLCH